jgi:hypothetical protein
MLSNAAKILLLARLFMRGAFVHIRSWGSPEHVLQESVPSLNRSVSAIAKDPFLDTSAKNALLVDSALTVLLRAMTDKLATDTELATVMDFAIAFPHTLVTVAQPELPPSYQVKKSVLKSFATESELATQTNLANALKVGERVAKSASPDTPCQTASASLFVPPLAQTTAFASDLTRVAAQLVSQDNNASSQQRNVGVGDLAIATPLTVNT